MGTTFTLDGEDLQDQIPEDTDVEIIINDIERPLRPPYTQHKVEIPGRAGAYDFGGEVARDFEINVTLTIMGAHGDVLDCARNINRFVGGKKTLVFDDDPFQKYKARVYEGIMLDDDPQFDDNVAEATIVFECSARNVEDSGTASSGTANTLTDTSKSWDDTGSGEWESYYVSIFEGTGRGQDRTIISNDTTTLTVAEDWEYIPDDTSKYEIYEY